MSDPTSPTSGPSDASSNPGPSATAELAVARFRDYPLFQDLDKDEVAEFLSHCRELDLAPGEEFIHEGDEDGHLFFVSEGEMEVFARDEDGGEHTLAHLSSPAVVGEVEFLTREPRAASVRAASPLRGLVVDGKRLQDDLEAGDRVTSRVFLYMARVLARRLAAMNRKFVELDQQAPGARFDELRDFQQRLMSEWTV